ncbi:12993_t:CDS:2 [Funneliformis mosseae]|uniref:12993_t:CDS:1 n=1 Tax=Funneliformis mosseae TaxID=27381 RepID=A0A9N9H2J5_FUNMO|nr:12993_t:CDS:2 [Funneliformis mosseae]
MDSIEKDSIEKSSTIGSDENYLISDIECTNLVPCILIDIFDRQIKRCPNYTKPGHTLCVCMSHFTFDQNRLHKKNQKQIRSVEEIYIYRYRNIQVPYVGLQVCSAFNDDNRIAKKNNNNTNQAARYICSQEHNHDTIDALKLLGR